MLRVVGSMALTGSAPFLQLWIFTARDIYDPDIISQLWVPWHWPCSDEAAGSSCSPAQELYLQHSGH